MKPGTFFYNTAKIIFYLRHELKSNQKIRKEKKRKKTERKNK